MKVLIVGNSAAGIGAVEGIRKTNREAEITIVTDEPYATYSRPLISYLIKGSVSRENMRYRAESFYADNEVKLVFDHVDSIDPAARTVRTSSGEIAYDALVLATGSSPIVPAIPGLSDVHYHTFQSLSDALALDSEIDAKRVLIVGGGLIGLKCAEAVAHRAAETWVVEGAERILPAVLDNEGSATIQARMEEEGVKFAVGCAAASFTKDTATLADGRTIGFDVLVMAVGVRPNVSLVQEAGGEVARGIVVDSSSRTSLPSVWAAGDCTVSRDISSGTDKVMAILPNAYRQGYAAGRSIAGEDEPFTAAFPMNAAGFFGLHVVSAGSYEGQAYETSGENTMKRLYTEGNRLKGFILIGDVARSGIYTSLIRDQTDLSTINFELIKDHPALMAFGAEKRKAMLGSKV